MQGGKQLGAATSSSSMLAPHSLYGCAAMALSCSQTNTTRLNSCKLTGCVTHLKWGCRLWRALQG